MFNLVKSKVSADASVKAFYFPTFEQTPTAEANREFLESNGVPLGSTDRWATGNVCYAQGWALGTLKYFAGSQIAGAFLSGQLKPEDILLTDGGTG